jgi:hypothetical protein
MVAAAAAVAVAVAAAAVVVVVVVVIVVVAAVEGEDEYESGAGDERSLSRPDGALDRDFAWSGHNDDGEVSRDSWGGEKH